MKPFAMTVEMGAQTYSPLRDIQVLAESLGLECIESDERLLQLDLDSPEAVEAHKVLCFFTQDELAQMWRESRDFVEDETQWP